MRSLEFSCFWSTYKKKHFTDKNRTLATGIVTAAASVGYFLAPLFAARAYEFCPSENCSETEPTNRTETSSLNQNKETTKTSNETESSHYH